MMPICQYKGCKKIVESTASKLLWKWDMWSKQDNPRACQDICLCNKHAKKVYKILQLEEDLDEQI